MRATLAVVLASTIASAADGAYAPWSQGRPQESLPALRAAATASGAWDAWLDLGLAAADAGHRGEAAAALLEAHRRAPERPEPRHALAALGSPLPPGWLDRLGPLAMPGTGVVGAVLLGLAGLALGWAIAGRRGRGIAAIGCVALLAAALPGHIARLRDGARALVAVTADTSLLDATGAPLTAVAAGTVLLREPGEPWSRRILVRSADGSLRGWLSLADAGG